VRHRAVRHRAVRHRAVRHRAVRHRAVRHRAVRHRAVRHRAVRLGSWVVLTAWRTASQRRPLRDAPVPDLRRGDGPCLGPGSRPGGWVSGGRSRQPPVAHRSRSPRNRAPGSGGPFGGTASSPGRPCNSWPRSLLSRPGVLVVLTLDRRRRGSSHGISPHRPNSRRSQGVIRIRCPWHLRGAPWGGCPCRRPDVHLTPRLSDRSNIVTEATTSWRRARTGAGRYSRRHLCGS
jgi:hypothetical protein